MENEKKIPNVCPKCGKTLEERYGRYGKFLGCTGYPECKYTFDLSKNKEAETNEIKKDELNYPINCPKCGKPLEERYGRYGRFLGCTGYPECRYTFNLPDLIKIKCPKCKKELQIRHGKYGKFLSCSGYPECKFAFNPEFTDQEDIFCPECGKVLQAKMGKYRKFIGCSGYPECRFTFDLR
ncbi:MAG: topoisomerase DNA-binding C4 zinc finger domain-containing protein [Promethearchaeota archaeon]